MPGSLTTFYGFLSLLFVHGFPETARFLSEKERKFVLHRLRSDGQLPAQEDFKWRSVRKAVQDYKTLLSAVFLIGMKTFSEHHWPKVIDQRARLCFRNGCAHIFLRRSPHSNNRGSWCAEMAVPNIFSDTRSRTYRDGAESTLYPVIPDGWHICCRIRLRFGPLWTSRLFLHVSLPRDLMFCTPHLFVQRPFGAQ